MTIAPSGRRTRATPLHFRERPAPYSLRRRGSSRIWRPTAMTSTCVMSLRSPTSSWALLTPRSIPPQGQPNGLPLRSMRRAGAGLARGCQPRDSTSTAAQAAGWAADRLRGYGRVDQPWHLSFKLNLKQRKASKGLPSQIACGLEPNRKAWRQRLELWHSDS